MAHIRKRGNSWVVEVCVDLKRRSKSFPTKREATAWGNEQEQDGILAHHTVQDALDRYRPISEAKKGAQAEISRLNALSVLGHHKLEYLTPAILAKWRDDRMREVAPVSVMREMIVLQTVLKKCVAEWGWLRSDPLKTVRKPTR